MKRNKILVIGDAILDRYVYGTVNRQSPEDASVPVLDLESEEYRLGGCLNVAANLKSLDPRNDVHLSSVFSRFTGRMLFERSIQADSSCMFLGTRTGDLEPSKFELIKTRVVDKQTGKQLVRIDNRLKYDDRDVSVYNCCIGLLNSFDAVVISDYSKGLVGPKVIEALSEYKGLVFVDTKNKDLSPWKNCIVKINDEEFEKSEGWADNQNFVVTQGAKGAFIPNPGIFVEPEESVEGADVVGAGDVFLAGLVTNYLETKNLLDAVKFANKVAGVSVKKQGTSEVRKKKYSGYE
jgi:bifunctional ADP-heptose synthase (sugar kinase/adenylyltransferase)